MTALTERQESFLNIMKESRVLEWKGYQRLLEREDGTRFFHVLREAGFFAPDRNPAPEHEGENRIRVPYWPPLGYLKAVAERCGKQGDTALADSVMEVVRSVSSWRDEKGQARSNYRTNWTFAEILGLLPTKAVTVQDVDLVEEWLNDPFDRTALAHALDGALSHFLDSTTPEDWQKAARILFHVTIIEWRKNSDREAEPFSVVDDFWLGEIISHHAKRVGQRAGQSVAEIMLGRVREVFSGSMRREYSSSYRPAVEQDAQNYQWRSAENRVVEGLRDVVMGWTERDVNGASSFVKSMLSDDLQMVRRIGIYVLAQRWTDLHELYSGVVGPELFDGQSHELYHLLQDRFAEMSPEQQAATFKAIDELPRPDRVNDPESFRRRLQYRWLSAIKGKGYAPADTLFAEFDNDASIGTLGDHPDFDSYISSGWVGPEQSPYASEELIAMAQAGTLTEKLNAFQPTGDWRKPTQDGLANALEVATRGNPEVFHASLSGFLSLKPFFQRAVIDGLRSAWETKADANWALGWENVVRFLEALCSKDDYWRERENHQRDAVALAIADLIRAGTADDKRAYDPALLPRTQPILVGLVAAVSGCDVPQEDAVFQALNNSKGRVIQALYTHTLRSARVADAQSGTHRGVWDAVSTTFDAELANCKNANYEFSTFAGMYLPQLQYLDAQWTSERVDQIFPIEYEVNATCAFDGLAYAAFTRDLYLLLSQHSVLRLGLGMQLRGRDAREKLLERIGAAYVWDIEQLDGNLFDELFRRASVSDLEVLARVFWMVRGDRGLSAEQKERIFSFGIRSLDWAERQERVPTELLASLSLLAKYATAVGPKERHFLEAVAPHVHSVHGSHDFVAELKRLAPQDSATVMDILRLMVTAHPPEYDYEGRLLSLVKLLVERGQKPGVVRIADQLAGIEGFPAYLRTLQPHHS